MLLDIKSEIEELKKKISEALKAPMCETNIRLLSIYKSKLKEKNTHLKLLEEALKGVI